MSACEKKKKNFAASVSQRGSLGLPWLRLIQERE